MKQFISGNFAKRSVICNVLLVLLLCVPIIMGLCCITTVPIMICMDGQKSSFVYYSILEINVIIALLAAYGFILRNKKIALAYGLTTLYSQRQVILWKELQAAIIGMILQVRLSSA